MDDRWIDARIDEAARELTEAARPSDMKPRVLARIAVGEAERAWPMAVWLAPAAMALVAAATLSIVMWPEGTREAAPVVRSEPNASLSGGTIAEVPVAREPAASPEPRPGASPGGQPRSAFPMVQAQLRASTNIALAPEQLKIRVMDLDAIAAEEASPIGPLDVTTLNVTRLEIEPIGSPGDLQ